MIICAWCYKTKDNRNPKFVSHGICEECAEKQFNKLEVDMEKNQFELARELLIDAAMIIKDLPIDKYAAEDMSLQIQLIRNQLKRYSERRDESISG